MRAGTRVRISWQENHDIPTWNETCACDRFTTHATEEYMDFYFVDERDAILFELTRG